MAQAFPGSRFVGIDTHEESLRAATPPRRALPTG
jgi:hypothetical protein